MVPSSLTFTVKGVGAFGMSVMATVNTSPTLITSAPPWEPKRGAAPGPGPDPGPVTPVASGIFENRSASLEQPVRNNAANNPNTAPTQRNRITTLAIILIKPCYPLNSSIFLL